MSEDNSDADHRDHTVPLGCLRKVLRPATWNIPFPLWLPKTFRKLVTKPGERFQNRESFPKGNRGGSRLDGSR